MRKSLLILSIAATMGALLATSAFAAKPTLGAAAEADTFGDRLINLPVDESTVDNKSVTVWFKYVKDAYAYTYDLVGSGAAAADKACDGTDLQYEKKGFILAKDLEDQHMCGNETTITKQGDEHGSAPTNGNVPLCSYTLPDLPDGNYAIAINPLVLGNTNKGSSYQEKRSGPHCKPVNDDQTAVTLPMSLDFTNMANLSNSGDDQHYQLFTVQDTAPAPTMAPLAIEPIFPLGNGNLFNEIPTTGNNVMFAFADDSGQAGRASWYEIYVQDKDGNRVVDFVGDNTVYGQWWNVAADSMGAAPVGMGIDCVQASPTATGRRVCTVSFTSEVLQLPNQSPNDKYTWWVKGYNAQGHGPWSTTPGTFVGAN